MNYIDFGLIEKYPNFLWNFDNDNWSVSSVQYQQIIYGINGTGSLFIKAIQAKDYNVLFVDMAIFTTIGLLANIVLDLLTGNILEEGVGSLEDTQLENIVFKRF